MQKLNFTFQNLGELIHNDTVFEHLFELRNHTYTFNFKPKTPFWRLGIRLSKNEIVEFYHPDHRYKTPDFWDKHADIHLGVGEWDTKNWTVPNKIYLVKYNLPESKEILPQLYTYVEFGNVIWKIDFDQDENILNLSYKAQGCDIQIDKIKISEEYKYFKVFAWADGIEYTIDCEFNILSYLPLTIGNVTFRLGDMFDPEPTQLSDVILLPASTDGDATSDIYSRASELGIPEPPPNNAGAIITYQVPNDPGQSLQAGYCYSVRENESSFEIIQTLCENILNYLRDQQIKTISLPLFGTGAGKLKPQIVARIYTDVFNKNPLAKNFVVSIAHKKDFALVRNNFEADSLNTPEIKSRLLSDIHSLDEGDVLNYDLIAENLFAILTDSATKPPLNVGIIAPWGRGKTNLMRRIQNKFDTARKILQSQGESEKIIALTVTTFDSIKRFFNWVLYSLFFTNKKNNNNSLIPTLDNIRSWLKMDKIGVKHNLPFSTVWFNPWNYQSCDMIWAGLANSVIEQVVSQIPNKIDQEVFWFQLRLARIDKTSLRRDIQTRLVLWIAKFSIWILVALFSGIFFIASLPVIALKILGLGTVIGIVTTVASKLKRYDVKISDAFDKYTKPPKYSENLGTFHEVQMDVDRVLDLCVDDEKPLIVFIDDLDRCSPSKVVEVIEAINVFINGKYNGRCYFILGMDAEMVAAALDVAYENMKGKLENKEHEYGSVGWYFLDKFIQLPFFIPTISEEKKKEYLKFLLAEKPQKKMQVSGNVDQNKLARVYANVMTIKDPEESAQEIYDAELTEEEKLELDKRILESIVRSNSQNKTFIEQASLYAKFISADPRSLKRFTNLLRFHSGYQYLRMKKNQTFVEAKILARWLAIMIRFPQFVRWLQADNDAKSWNSISIEKKAELIDTLADQYQKNDLGKQSDYGDWLNMMVPKEYLLKNEDVKIEDLEEMKWLKTKSFFELLMFESSDKGKFVNALACNVW